MTEQRTLPEHGAAGPTRAMCYRLAAATGFRASELRSLLYRDRQGHVADFHSLRVLFISRVVAGGASVKEAQTLARHSTPLLTMNTCRKQKNPCEGRCCRHIAGVSEAEAPVGVEPTMADLQSAAEPRKARGKHGIREQCTRRCTQRARRSCPRSGGRGMVEPASCGPGRHPRNGRGEQVTAIVED